ncbi:MAG: cyclopropane-fatty-acyl-phospholipid synthase family protein [Sandaracinaceae bacterium]
MTDTLYEEAAYYRMLFRERSHDTQFYRDACKGVTRVMELGVGDGRMATALAHAGHEVTGVDLSEAMLASLEQRLEEHTADVRARVHATCGDARSVRLGQTFDRVLYPFNGMAHFHDLEAQAAVLSTVSAHLAPGGRFVFDVMLPDPQLLMGGASSVPRLEHPRTGRVCRLEESYRYDAFRQVLTIETVLIERETGARQTLTLALRQFFPQETALLLDRSGFRVLRRDDTLGDTVGWVCERR